MKVVEALLSSGLEAVALKASGQGCVPWTDQSPTFVLNRISSELDQLGRDPSFGEIVWFNAPKKKTRFTV